MLFNYNRSSLNADGYIDELNREIQDFCVNHPLTDKQLDDDTKKQLIGLLLRRSGTAAFQGASRLEGGPFGAIVVDFNTENGMPKVVGFGTNHVVPNSDPSAHAEMTAIRDTAKRLGRTDLSGLTLITSCECCPMCLSAATGCKIDQIYFAATRKDAADAGFTDADQYRLMTEGGIEKHASKTVGMESLLTSPDGVMHDAVVVVPHGDNDYLFYGSYHEADPTDPTDLPIMQAIKKACKGLADLRSEESGKPEKVFHLPEDTMIISRDMPHPMSLITADWARIGRIRGIDPDSPLEDKPQKNISNILYLNDTVEKMPVRDKQSHVSNVDSQKVWDEITHPSAIHLDTHLGRAHTAAFQEWKRLVASNFMPKY